MWFSGYDYFISYRWSDGREYALALALALDSAPKIHALACDTDGIDGSEDNAGAYIGPDTLARAAAANLDPHAALAANDSYGVFAALGDALVGLRSQFFSVLAASCSAGAAAGE